MAHKLYVVFVVVRAYARAAFTATLWQMLYWWCNGGRPADDIYTPRRWYCPAAPRWAYRLEGWCIEHQLSDF